MGGEPVDRREGADGPCGPEIATDFTRLKSFFADLAGVMEHDGFERRGDGEGASYLHKYKQLFDMHKMTRTLAMLNASRARPAVMSNANASEGVAGITTPPIVLHPGGLANDASSPPLWHAVSSESRVYAHTPHDCCTNLGVPTARTAREAAAAGPTRLCHSLPPPPAVKSTRRRAPAAIAVRPSSLSSSLALSQSGM